MCTRVFFIRSLFRCPRHPDRLQKRIVNNIRLGQGLVQLVPTVVSTAAGRHTAQRLATKTRPDPVTYALYRTMLNWHRGDGGGRGGKWLEPTRQ